MTNYAVVAGEQREFWEYVKENLFDKLFEAKPQEVKVKDTSGNIWFYCRSPEQLRGLRNFELVFAGTWHRHGQDAIHQMKQLEKIDKVSRIKSGHYRLHREG